MVGLAVVPHRSSVCLPVGGMDIPRNSADSHQSMPRRRATPKPATPPPGVIAGRDTGIVLPGITAIDLDLIDDALSRSVRDASARRTVRSRNPRPAPGRTLARGRARRPGGGAAAGSG